VSERTLTVALGPSTRVPRFSFKVPDGVVTLPVRVSVPVPAVITPPPAVLVIDPPYLAASDVVTVSVPLPSRTMLPLAPASRLTDWPPARVRSSTALAEASLTPLLLASEAPGPSASVPLVIVVAPVYAMALPSVVVAEPAWVSDPLPEMPLSWIGVAVFRMISTPSSAIWSWAAPVSRLLSPPGEPVPSSRPAPCPMFVVPW